MAVKHFDNYVTTIWQWKPAAIIATERADVFGTQLGDTISEEKLLEIEHQLALAHEHFLARRYLKAIDAYKLTLGLILKLHYPSFKPEYTLRPEFTLPYHDDLFQPMLQAALELIELMPIPLPKPDFGILESEVVWDKAFAMYDDIGIKVTDGLPNTVRRATAIGTTYAECGQWERAEFYFRRAYSDIHSADPSIAQTAYAALSLNLSSIYIQTGRTNEALKQLGQAEEVFAQQEDFVGQAQVSFNRAAAYTRAGNLKEANAQLEQGKRYLVMAQGLPGEEIAPTLTGLTRTEAVQPLIGTATRFNYSIQPNKLIPLLESQGLAVTYRLPGKAGGWTVQEVETRAETTHKAMTKSLGVMFGDHLVQVKWESGTAVPSAEIIDQLYAKRVDATNWWEVVQTSYVPTDLAVQLPHLYCYVIPVALGDCYNATGEYQKAETEYLKAANYKYINVNIEVPALWRKLAENVLDWGDALYKDEEYQDALDIYRKVVEVPSSADFVWEQSPLYVHAKLKLTGDTVEAMLEQYATEGAGTLNPLLAAVVLEIRARLLQLQAGLDFLGIPTSIVPIWTFEYLQNVARYFGQQASQAERDYINFQARGEDEAYTRQQLEQSLDLAKAERELARQQREAAESETAAYLAGAVLANLRANNAQVNRDDYAAMTTQRIELERLNAWYSSQNPWELDKTIKGEGPDVGKHIHEVIAARTEKIGHLTRNYELASMDRQIDELQHAEAMAQQQLNAANARVEAAEQLEVVAELRIIAAEDNLDTFDSQLFTPDVWYQMAAFMHRISKSYFTMALKIARIMQRAYNFENDLARHFIRTDYTSMTIQGMLAADALLRDIDSFTYDQITTVQRKEIPIVQTISLANSFPFLFETEFRQHGRMAFETRLEDSDIAYPGTYSRRIMSIEVEIEGILPPGGVRGTLINGGISRYRNPSGNIKYRIQSKETLVLSEFRLKSDAVVFPRDPNQMRIFEGAGVAGTWELEMPPSANDLDFSSITDVRLVFYYRAKFDPILGENMKAQVAALAGVTQRARNIALRYVYPDLYFGFQKTGQLAFTLSPLDFPFNELDPQISAFGLVLMPNPGVDPTGWTVRCATPGHTVPVAAQADAQGQIVVGAEHPWDSFTGSTALGDYLIEMTAADNPMLVQDGTLNLRPIRNIVLLITYDYTPRI